MRALISLFKPTSTLIVGVFLMIVGNAWAQAPEITTPSDPLEVTSFDRFFGEESAINTFVEYASMTCPHCASFHADLYTDIKAEFIETGKARFVYRDLPLDSMAFRASLIARCVAEDSYEAMINHIYKQQAQWRQSESNLLNLFAIAGISVDEARACINDKDMQDNLLAVRNRGFDEAGVSATPTLFLNGKRINLRQAKEDALEDIRNAMQD